MEGANIGRPVPENDDEQSDTETNNDKLSLNSQKTDTGDSPTEADANDVVTDSNDVVTDSNDVVTDLDETDCGDTTDVEWDNEAKTREIQSEDDCDWETDVEAPKSDTTRR